MREYKAEILSIGTEILLGNIVNTNAQYLSRELASEGILVYHQSVVGDNPGRLEEALEEGFARADLVISTGGLGPTTDDLSKETAARFFGRKMVRDEKALANILERMTHMKREITPNNYKQADLPEGCKFSPRCPKCMDICLKENPPVYQMSDSHMIKCHLFKDVKDAPRGGNN